MWEEKSGTSGKRASRLNPIIKPALFSSSADDKSIIAGSKDYGFPLRPQHLALLQNTCAEIQESILPSSDCQDYFTKPYQKIIVVSYDPSVYSVSDEVQQEELIGTLYTLAEIKTQLDNQDRMNLLVHRNITATITCFADGVGKIFYNDKQELEPIQFVLTTGSMPSYEEAFASEYKAKVTLLFRRWLESLDLQGVQIVLVPMMKNDVYLEGLAEKEKDAATRIILGALKEAIALIKFSNIQEVVYVLPNEENNFSRIHLQAARILRHKIIALVRPEDLENKECQTLSKTILSIVATDPFDAAKLAISRDYKVGFVHMGSSLAIGGHYRQFLDKTDKTQSSKLNFETLLFNLTNAADVQAIASCRISFDSCPYNFSLCAHPHRVEGSPGKKFSPPIIGNLSPAGQPTPPRTSFQSIINLGEPADNTPSPPKYLNNDRPDSRPSSKGSAIFTQGGIFYSMQSSSNSTPLTDSRSAGIDIDLNDVAEKIRKILEKTLGSAVVNVFVSFGPILVATQTREDRFKIKFASQNFSVANNAYVLFRNILSEFFDIKNEQGKGINSVTDDNDDFAPVCPLTPYQFKNKFVHQFLVYAEFYSKSKNYESIVKHLEAVPNMDNIKGSFAIDLQNKRKELARAYINLNMQNHLTDSLLREKLEKCPNAFWILIQKPEHSWLYRFSRKRFDKLKVTGTAYTLLKNLVDAKDNKNKALTSSWCVIS